MNKPLVSKALAVGTLVAVTGAAFLVAFTFFKKGGYSEDESYLVHAAFSDATGLTWKSRVQIAGIQVGEVERITLDGSRARLDLRIKNGIDLKADACLTKTFPSALLPDALLEAIPGSATAPSLSSLPADQREITCVREATSVQKVIDSLGQISADIQLLTGDLAKTVGGQEGSMREIIENLAQITRRIDATVAANEGRLSSILENVDVVSGDLRSITQSERERVKQISRNVESLTAQLDRVAASLQDVMGTGRAAAGGTGAGGPPGPEAQAVAAAQAEAVDQAKGVKQAVAKLNDGLARLDDLLGTLQEGKSVASRLLVDEKMGRQLDAAVGGVTDYVDRLNRMQFQIQLRSEWLLNQTGAKAYFGARLVPRPDKYYFFEVVSDPRGVDTVTTETITTRDPVTGVDTTTVSTRTLHEERLTFTLMMARRFGRLTVRGGIIESSGGVGADLHMLDDHLTLSVQVYQFSRPYQDVFPRAKVWFNYSFLQYFFLTAGADDFLNRWQSGRYPGGPRFAVGNDVFFGGGLLFTDDDLKVLMGSGAGSLVGGAAAASQARDTR